MWSCAPLTFPPYLLANFPHLPTKELKISTVIHNLSPIGGNLWQKGDFSLNRALTGLLLNSVGELSDLVIDRSALSHQLTDLAIGMHNRCMVAPAECLADLWK